PDDVKLVHEIMSEEGRRVPVIAKIEKPEAVARLDEIVSAFDALMVARGDLGVELPLEQVPLVQKHAVQLCREQAKPVIVATQMLDSMVHAPAPTRAEASDVATAVYDGADAVMLSAESASGQYPIEAVTMMTNIIVQTEADPQYRDSVEAFRTPPRAVVADAIEAAVRTVAGILHVAATVAYTSSGYSALRLARERPEAPIIGMTPNIETARRMALYWGVHAVVTEDVRHVSEMTKCACKTALEEGFAHSGETIAIAAGVPFGRPGTTNLLHVAQVP
ncbi:MAG TPA: pyruvate kinase, partial [Anaeromyxobacteraceae bacterium]|nr:pyruvate kinase [Anaeromyxobacteraceae bacterium]